MNGYMISRKLNGITTYSSTTVMASHKITKLAGAKPTDEFELNVAQALVDLENNVADLKKDLRPLSITAAKEVRITTTIPIYTQYASNPYFITRTNDINNRIMQLVRLRLVVARRLLSSLFLFLSSRLSTRSNKGKFIIE